VGRLDEARADLDQALTLDPDDGDAYALRAIIAVALNDRADGARQRARGRQAQPQVRGARLALSYALQADLQLEAARDELLQAVRRSSGRWACVGAAGRIVALARLSRSGQRGGQSRRGTGTPERARANTVLGFAALDAVDTSAARTAFERAISLEPDNPLARLGLGLAKIREGHLPEGRRDIEIAVALNPDDSIGRSYLGKAYFEEKREPLPGSQFERAKELDPNDPTPWFYDAIRKQTLNRPVEGVAGSAEVHRAERQSGSLPFAPAARRRSGGSQREPGANLPGPRIRAGEPAGRVAVGDSRSGDYSGTGFSRTPTPLSLGTTLPALANYCNRNSCSPSISHPFSRNSVRRTFSS
jgi:tetratricopeptide (TPR) repeat protein